MIPKDPKASPRLRSDAAHWDYWALHCLVSSLDAMRRSRPQLWDFGFFPKAVGPNTTRWAGGKAALPRNSAPLIAGVCRVVPLPCLPTSRPKSPRIDEGRPSAAPWSCAVAGRGHGINAE